MNNQLKHYKYGGARALVLLHEQELRKLLDVWRVAKARDLALPETEDVDYESLETLLVHNLRSARGYMNWICESLELDDPQINETPDIEQVEDVAEEYIEHMLERWRLPLADLAPERYGEVYKAWGDMPMCIEAMLEHAVMHPIRHSFQLNNLLAESDKND